ncbi:MAG: peptidylprolyl isomerase [Anaerolineales bacterium]|nr:peptidylprolyl isomerase [Anaerolineales bacterium]
MPNEPGNKPVLHKKHVARLQRERQQGRIILYTFFGALALVVALLVYGWLDINYFQLQRPVAKVGDTEILVHDFEPRVRLQRQQLLSQYAQYAQYAQYFGMNVDTQLQQIQSNLDSPLTVGQSVLDQMVNEELIRQEAAKRGITVSEDELNEAIQGGFGYYPNGTPTPSATPTQVTLPDVPAEAFSVITATPPASATPISTESPPPAEGTPQAEATVEPSATPTAGPTATALPTSTPYTFQGFESQLKDANARMTKLGFDEGIYRSIFEAQILERKLKDEITADVAQIEQQVWARHILVSDETLAKGIIERLKNGEDFAALAVEFSSDTGSAVSGGDLGWFGRGAMVPEFEAAAFALEKSGDFSAEPVQSDFGYHIIQLVAKQDRPLTADQYEAAKDKVFSDWQTAAKEEYGVDIFDVWQSRVPSEPNFVTAATEAANAQMTSQAEALKERQATATP